MGWSRRGGQRAGVRPRGMLRAAGRSIPSGWSRGAGWEGGPQSGAGWGSRVGPELPLREGSARDAALQQVPGSRRGPCAAIAALFVCLPARHAPSSRSQPLGRPPPGSWRCSGSSGSPAFLPSPGKLLPRPRQRQGAPSPAPRRCGGKTGSCCLVIDSPPPAAERLRSERFQPGKMGTWGAGPPGTCSLR